MHHADIVLQYSFQSTLLMRGATPADPGVWSCRPYFNPRSSCEERRKTTFAEVYAL